jgi:hypothetical protein
MAGPGRVDIDNEELTVLFVEVGVEMFEVLDDGC